MEDTDTNWGMAATRKISRPPQCLLTTTKPHIIHIYTYIYIYIIYIYFKKKPGIPTTPVFGVLRRKTSDFGVVPERPQKYHLRFSKNMIFISYVMKTWRFIIEERAFCYHGSWLNMQFRSEKRPIYRKIMQNLPRSLNPTDVRHIFNLSTSTCIYTCNAHSSIVWTRLLSLLTSLFSRFLTENSRTFGVVVDTFGVLLTETSQIFHDSFAFSTAAHTTFVVCTWKKSLKIWSKSRKQHVDLLKRPMFSKIAVLVLLNTVFLLMNLEYLCSMSLNIEIKYCRKPKKRAYLRTCLVNPC